MTSVNMFNLKICTRKQATSLHRLFFDDDAADLSEVNNKMKSPPYFVKLYLEL